MENHYILLPVFPNVWADESLNYPEKIILSLIWGQNIQNKCAVFSQDWIANNFGWSPQFVNEVVSLLALRGIIKVRREFGELRMSVFVPGEPDPCITITEADWVEITQ